MFSTKKISSEPLWFRSQHLLPRHCLFWKLLRMEEGLKEEWKKEEGWVGGSVGERNQEGERKDAA